MEAEASKRQHRKAQAGSKFKKKQEKEKKKAGHDNHRHNPKAFTHSGGHISVRRRVQRSAEMDQKRTSKETIDKTPDIPPPFIVAVQGPPGVGKSTLIKSLVKHYTRHNISDVNGPITLVSGRNRRITFVECPNNMQQMIDVAKIADLVLLMIDGTFGFEMETFEFLNIMQVHGFPRVMGVLTHLDNFRDNKTLRKTKKKLKNRFWTEIYDGAKLFYLSGLQYGRYNKTEIKNLTRFLAVQKFHPLAFRTAHPYVLALRMEDQTHTDDDPSAPRTINLYGYVKGARMREGQLVHIPGAGDFTIRQLDDFIDPCPAPQATIPIEKRKKSNETGSRLLRSLKDSQRGIYAPGCDVGNVQLDADAMYIHIPGHQIGFTRADRLVTQSGKIPVDKKISNRAPNDEEEDEEEIEGLDGHEGEFGRGDADEDLKGRRMTDVPEAVKMVHTLQDAKGALARARAGNLSLLPGGSIVSEGHDYFSRNDVEPKIREITSEDEEEDEEDSSDDDDSLLEEDRKRALEENGNKDSALPWKKRNAHSAADAFLSDDDEDDDEDEDDENDSEMDDDEEEEEEEGQYEIESGSSIEDDENDENDEESVVDMEYDDSEDDESESESDEAIKKFMGNSTSSRSAVSPSLPSSSTKSLDVVYGRLRWQGADSVTATASSQAFLQPESEKLTLFDDDDDDDGNNNDARGISQIGIDSGSAQGGLLGQVPYSHAAFNGFDCSKLPPAAFLETPMPAARLNHLGTAGVMWKVTMGWTEEALEDLKSRKFITGGWDGPDPNAEDEEGEEDHAMDDGEEKSGDDDGDDDGKSKLAWRRGQKDINPDKDEDGNQIFYDEEGNVLEGVAAFAAKKKQDAVNRRKTLDELEALKDTSSKAIGTFVRIVVANVPAAWVRNYSLRRPVIVGGLLPGEAKVGMLQCKVKRHRWSPRVLKNQDPLLFSIGWRRFQSIPTYALEDRNQARIRMLKYTPEHMHCLATFYGPIHPPNTGILGVRQWGTGVQHFRVSLTGSCIAVAANFKIVKKLKLVGEPVSVMKHTAFIKGMFTSDLEVAKCIGSRIETVSGIRGQIKKADGQKGNFRATFEDKIIMSDLVMMKAWTAVEPKRFFNPVIDVEGIWRRIKTIAELRRSLKEPVPFKHDSIYQSKPERAPANRHEGHVKIPKSIMKNLPFDARPKNIEKKKGEEDKDILSEVSGIMKSEYERRVDSLVHRLETVRSDRERISKEKMQAKQAVKAKLQAKEDEKKEERRKENKKEHYKKQGKVEAAKRRKLRLGDE